MKIKKVFFFLRILCQLLSILDFERNYIFFFALIFCVCKNEVFCLLLLSLKFVRISLYLLLIYISNEM